MRWIRTVQPGIGPVEGDARAYQIALIAHAQQAAGRVANTGWNAGKAFGHARETPQLGFIKRVLGIVRAGQVRHQQGRSKTLEGGPGDPHRETQPVHAGVDMNGNAPVAIRPPCGQLLLMIDDRNQPRGGQRPRRIRQRALEHVYGSLRHNRFQRRALGGGGYEEVATAKPRKGGRRLHGPQAITVRLDHGTAMPARRGAVKPVVAGLGISINAQASGHLVSCPASFWYFRVRHARQCKAWSAGNIRHIAKGHNAAVARMANSRRACPKGPVAALRPLAMEPPFPAGTRLATGPVGHAEVPETCGTRH